MHSPEATRSRLTSFITFATILLVVMVLRVAQDVVVPVALSVLLAFLLSPCVDRLARWGLPEVLAVGGTATLAFAILASLGWVVGTQAMAIIEELPRHEENIRAKIAAVKSLAPSTTSRTSGLVNSLKEEVDGQPESEAGGTRTKRGKDDPIPVILAGTRESQLDTMRQIITPALGPLGTGGIVVIFVVVILFQRHDLRDRFINLISAGRMNVATQAVDDAARRVSRYLGMQLLVNATYGLPVGIGLYFIGVPGAVLWAMLATFLRFIPFLGPWIAAAFPIVLAAAIDPGWTTLLYTVAMFVVLELVSNNIVEVVVYGSSTGISSFALLVAAVFWTWLWGTPGLFLSTPLTACLLVMGNYVPGLKFLSILLGSAPSMTAPAHFYQRMLSMNFEGMLALARKYVKERSVAAFYDDVFIPALAMSEEERHTGALAEVRQRFIVEAGRDLVEELSADRDTEAPVATSKTQAEVSMIMLAIPASDEADELVALMLQHLMALRGVNVQVNPMTMSMDQNLEMIRDGQIGVAIVSAMPPSAVTAARKACRHLKSGQPQTQVLVGIWSQEARAVDLQPRFRIAKPEGVVTSLGEAVAFLDGIAHQHDKPDQASGVTELDAFVSTSTGPAPEAAEAFDRIRRDLAGTFEVPVSLVKIIDLDRAFWEALPNFPREVDVVGDALRETPLASVSEPDESVVCIEDTRKDRRMARNPVLEERGIHYLACAYLRAREGRVVGMLCVIDTKVRTCDENALKILELRGAELMATIEKNRRATESKNS